MSEKTLRDGNKSLNLSAQQSKLKHFHILKKKASFTLTFWPVWHHCGRKCGLDSFRKCCSFPTFSTWEFVQPGGLLTVSQFLRFLFILENDAAVTWTE